jgi:hypothetical protein
VELPRRKHTAFTTRRKIEILPFLKCSNYSFTPEAFSPGLRRPGHEAGHSRVSSGDGKYEWNYPYATPNAFLACGGTNRSLVAINIPSSLNFPLMHLRR